LGGMLEDQFVHAIFPSFISEQNLHINYLELLTIVVSLRTWGKYLNSVIKTKLIKNINYHL
jgi:hypothetical protein